MLSDRSRTPSPERLDNTKILKNVEYQRPPHQDFTYNPPPSRDDLMKNLRGKESIPESSQRHDSANKLKIATFDSGFGGFFTAKAIEHKSRKINKKYHVDIDINHYGDTKNAPYGEKSPRSIASLTTKRVYYALSQKSDMVFIACNTASTQYETVKESIERKRSGYSDRVISIIDKTVEHVSSIINDTINQSINQSIKRILSI